ncbi:MAG TPA: alkaline phosphatase family protein [Stellaceae bacterium]|nr:alkaline phosphatase family protein [Stellaceae bacterium]
MPIIEHVVVLMLENRSFDSLLGRLYENSERFDGLDGSESNPWHKPDGSVEEVPVWNSAEVTQAVARLPNPEPGELFTDVNMQLFGLDARPGAMPTMSGFVDNYARQPPPYHPDDPRGVMHCFLPSQVPMISSLARQFGVCDRWHAAAPCETWPNRYFAHCGTAGGNVDNNFRRFPYQWPRPMPTIFRRLGACGHSWRIYFHDAPQTATLLDLWPKIPTHFCLFDAEFERHAHEGRLPAYSFIEPRYFPGWFSDKPPNDQHPPHNLLYGEQLIAKVYNAVRNAPTWPRTLFLITYDEHGGCFDHVPPPAAVPPGPPYQDGFTFDRYGVRVPAVIVSPYVAPGSIVRPPPGPDGAERRFDHASIPATLQALFDLGPPLTPRVAAAPDLLCALNLPEPTNDGPPRLTPEPAEPHPSELREYRLKPRNRHQRNLRHPLLQIPAAAASAAGWIRGTSGNALRGRRGRQG